MKQENAIHLAIIPDGNRRWAKARMFHPWKGHEVAVENFRTLTDWCRDDERIHTLTVWCFSTENWKRDAKEVEKLMQILETYLKKERDTFMQKKTRFIHSGHLDRIPASLAKLITDVTEETKDQTEFTLHLALDYGGKDEIIRAIQKIKDPLAVTEASFREYLDHPEIADIDLILRTSNEKRTSNFFLWQSAYAEWIFSEKLFPDLNTSDLESALTEFDHRTRRFGS